MSRNSGGCCDCGEDESWKNPLGCHLHKETLPSDPLTFDESALKSLYGELFDFIVPSIENYTRFHDPVEPGNLCLVLLNDEVHSFEDVIYLLKKVINSNDAEAREIAEAVDSIGFSCIFRSPNISDCSEKTKGISLGGLENRVINLELLTTIIAVDVLQEWIKNSLDNMRLQQLECIFDLACDSKSNFLKSFLVYDSLLWKNVRKNFQSILIKISLISPASKYRTAKLFLDHFHILLENYINETRENHLTILNFLVQLFSTPTVICKLVENDELVPKILGLACEFVPRITLPGFQRGLSVCLQAICYALSDSTVKDRNLFLNINYFSLLIEMCKSSFANSRFIIERISHEHVLYDDQKWISAFNFSLAISRFIHSFISAITFDNESARTFLIRLKSKVESCSHDIPKTDFSKLSSSWYQPFIWSFAFIQSKQFLSDLDIFQLPVLELSFQTELLYYQISSGFWVRNGQSVQSQASLYASTDFCFYFRLPSCFVIQSFLHVIEAKQFDEVLASSLHFKEIYSHPEKLQQLKLFKMISWLLVSLITNQFSLEDSDEVLEKIVLSLLYIQPYSFSQLCEDIPSPYNAKTKAIEAILSKYATISSKETSISYNINPSYSSSFNPYFYGYTESQRNQAISHVQSFSTFKLEDSLKTNLDASINSSSFKLLGENSTSEFLSLAVSLCFDFSDAYLLQNSLILYFIAFSTGNSLSLDHGRLREFYARPEYSTLRSLIYSVCSFQKDFQLPISLESTNDTRRKNREKYEEKFRLMQMNFVKHSSYENGTNEEFEKCIVCQEALHLSLDAYGKLVCIQRSTLLKAIMTDSPYDSSFFIDGCSHCIHYECFRKLPIIFYQGSLPRRSCPMCRKICSHVFCLPTEYCTKYTLNELLALNGFYSLHVLIETIMYTFDCSRLPGFVGAKTDNILVDLIHFCISLIKDNFKSAQTPVYDRVSSRITSFNNILTSVVCKSTNSKKFPLLFNKDEVNALLSLLDRASPPEYIETFRNILCPSNPELMKVDNATHLPKILIPLPAQYDELVIKYNSIKCKNCGLIPTEPSVCLFCGELVCARSHCCFKGKGECNQHYRKCCPTLGLFLMIRRSSILVLLENVGFTISAPFLTKHFEVDLDLR